MTLPAIIINQFSSRFANAPYVAISRVVNGSALYCNPTAVHNLRKSDLYTRDDVLELEKERLTNLQ